MQVFDGGSGRASISTWYVQPYLPSWELRLISYFNFYIYFSIFHRRTKKGTVQNQHKVRPLELLIPRKVILLLTLMECKTISFFIRWFWVSCAYKKKGLVKQRKVRKQFKFGPISNKAYIDWLGNKTRNTCYKVVSFHYKVLFFRWCHLDIE